VNVSTDPRIKPKWLWRFPSAIWLAEYRAAWLPHDVIAGVTLTAYAIPVSLAYATLAGLPAQVGVYGYLLGGLGYALLGTSRQLAIGPTSAISLMIAGTVGAMAEGDAQRSRPSILAVWALMTSSNLLDCTTGRSVGFAPLRMRPT
jgi:MFS superfamily sulfate permease-like transporter